MKPLISVVIRTLNESKYLEELLSLINCQHVDDFNVEVVVIDSGSTDGTLGIAEAAGARITFIEKEQFTFGRSLNMGCEFARGDYLVLISGHCLPASQYWLRNLVTPLHQKKCNITYGRQLAGGETKFSEGQLFDKFFPESSDIPQAGYFCNNANAAVTRQCWLKFKYCEQLTGCEDMDLAKKVVGSGGAVGYVADAPVYHLHDETWKQVKTRYEREAYAIQFIEPSLTLSFFDSLQYFTIGVIKDCRAALNQRRLTAELASIICFRWAQYRGGYVGGRLSRSAAEMRKKSYFYPRITNEKVQSITSGVNLNDG